MSISSTHVYYTTNEIAEMLKISERSVLRYIKAGELRASKIGGGYRVKDKDLADFIEQRTFPGPINPQKTLKSSNQ